ncbi:hypothetical protein [Bradyrhizobium sp. USDA 4506]
MRRIIAALVLTLCVSLSLAQNRSPESLTCAQQLAELGEQYNTECAPKFGRPPSCDRCPPDSTSCLPKCNECKIIYQEMKKKEGLCGE